MNQIKFYSGKKILVAGAGGFIGSHLVDELISLGANVKATLFKTDPIWKNPKADYLFVDLREQKDCMRVTKNIDYVFMCAANSSGSAVIQNSPLNHLTPNVLMNTQILSAAYKNKVSKFCFISSNTVYPVSENSVTEKDVTGDFFDKYFIVGWMKYFSEKMCEIYSTRLVESMSCLIVRPGNLYGPRDKFNKTESKVIASLVRKVCEKQNPIEVWGDGLDVKDFLYIKDFIDGLIKTFTIDKNFEIFNIASGEKTTINQVISELIKIESLNPLMISYNRDMPTMIPKRFIDISKIKELTDWVPKTTINNGLRETVRWYKQNFNNVNPDGQRYDNF